MRWLLGRPLALGLLGLALSGNGWLGSARGEDWPQWMGPSRDNVWSATGIMTRFPEGGPTVVWRSPIAGGYSGPAVVGNRLFVTDFVTEEDVKVSNFDRKPAKGTERVLCLDARTGEELWKFESPVTYAISYPAGPRCTPLVDGQNVMTSGAEGHLHCFNASDGKVVWSHDLKTEYKTNSALWGYANHPLIDGDKLLCIVGGEGSHAVAFNKHTGKEIWRYGTASEQGYSPPVVIDVAGQRQLILMSPDFIAAVDPESGKELWTESYTATSGSIIMTPLQVGKNLFVGGYANRNLMLELSVSPPAARVLFRDKPKTGISPVNVQPFLDGDLLYGMDGDGTMMAVEIPSGRRLWENGQPLGERPVQTGTAFIVRNGEYFYLFAETGELVIAQLSRDGYQEIDRAKVIEPTNNAFGRPVVWSAAAFANGRMYIRNDEECVCVELTENR
jgi:outer membrane protein assembly factor BamB